MTIQRHGRWEYTTQDGQDLKRRIGTTKWVALSPPPSPPLDSSPSTNLLTLYLVRETQAAGEPYHWALFLAQENSAGARFEVRGDTMCMYHNHQDLTNPLIGESFNDSFVLAEAPEAVDKGTTTEDDTARSEAQIKGLPQRVKFWANREPPPAAENRREVVENCQSWCVRVVTRLVEEGFVEARWLVSLKEMMQPIR